MRGKVLDINSLEAFVELESGELTSIPISEVTGASIGDYVSISVSNSISPGNHNISRYIANPLDNIF